MTDPLQPLDQLLAKRKAGALAMTIPNDPVQRGSYIMTQNALLADIQEIEVLLPALRAALAPTWQPMETAPIEGRFLATDGKRQIVMDGHILSLGLLPEVPNHLSTRHWTYWMPLPPLPAAPPETGR